MEQMEVVEQTLKDIGIINKPILVVFNKIDAFTYIKKDEDDLTPMKRENYSLDDLKEMYFAKNDDCVFVSAKDMQNIDEFKEKLFEMVKKIHFDRYPYNTI